MEQIQITDELIDQINEFLNDFGNAEFIAAYRDHYKTLTLTLTLTLNFSPEQKSFITPRKTELRWLKTAKLIMVIKQF